MSITQLELSARQRLLHWVAYAGDRVGTIVPPEIHGENLLYNLRITMSLHGKAQTMTSETRYRLLAFIFRHEDLSSPAAACHSR
jgi:hypothetical protein